MRRKLFCSILCAALVMGSVCQAIGAEISPEETAEGTVVSAEGGSDVKTDEIILYAKELFGIGDEYDEFDYTLRQADNETIWQLDWRSSADDSSLHIGIDGEKYVRSYNKYKPSKYREGLGALTRQQAEKKADEFMKLVVPEKYSAGLKLRQEQNGYGYDGMMAYVHYDYYVNDIPCANNAVTIDVSRDTGEVMDFEMDKSLFMLRYPSVENLISEDKSKQVFRDNTHMALEYMKGTSKEDGGSKIFPAYHISSADNTVAVDAVTGEPFGTGDDYLLYNGYDGAGFGRFEATEDASEAEGGKKVALSEKEIASIEEKKDLISPEEALAAVEKAAHIDDRSGMTSALYSDSDKNYFWDINIFNDNVWISANVDATDGRLRSFYDYNCYYDENGQPSDYDTMAAEAKRLAQEFAGDKLPQTTLEFSEDKPDDDIVEYSTFTYQRMENGIPCNSNHIVIKFSNDNKLFYYGYEWDENAEFSDVSDAVGEDRAYTALFDITKPRLCYISDEGVARPAYLYEGFNYVYLDKYASRINSDGEPYKEDPRSYDYTDIKGTKYEDIIRLLKNNGYMVNRNEFKPTEPISTEDFAEFFKMGGYSLLKGNNAAEDDGYKFYFIDDKTFGENLTRYEACEILASYKFGQEIGKHPEIFKDELFADVTDEYYKGYVAVCKGFGYINGDQNNVFDGGRLITNEEAAVILYNYLTK